MNTSISANSKTKALPANTAANKNTAPPATATAAVNAKKSPEQPKKIAKNIESSASAIGDSPPSKGLPDSFFCKKYSSKRQQRKNTRRASGKGEIAGKIAFPMAALFLVGAPVASGFAVSAYKDKKKADKKDKSKQTELPVNVAAVQQPVSDQPAPPQATNLQPLFDAIKSPEVDGLPKVNASGSGSGNQN